MKIYQLLPFKIQLKKLFLPPINFHANMATYKKRGYKPKNKAEKQDVEQLESTTAEVFNTLDETANKSEEWIEKNSKPLFYGLITVAALILGYFSL